jgi:GR25 family glycosyltransferase involved in LPS biosynthesis
MLERPVKRLPYVWIPDVLKEYVTSSSNPCDISQPLSIVIGEKNTSNTSSCLVPLVGAVKASNVKEVVLLNATQLKDNQYFQENLVKNTAVFKSPPIFYEDRLRYADLTGCVMVSHIRHVPFRPGLLDLLWLNLPLIHNCALLKSMGTYYEDNDVEGLTKALETFSHKTVNRELVEDMWSVSKGVQGWAAVLQKKVLRITFTDMWEGFDIQDNFFLDLMRSVSASASASASELDVIGTTEPGDLLICGPFGSVWQEERFRKQRKVYYSGEPPLQGETSDARIDLFLTHSPVETDRELRLPIWQLFVEWFGSPPSVIRNPNRLPKELLVKPSEGQRSEFCAFVVSNPLCVERNVAFDAINAYKRVNSGGRYKNNLEGGPLAAAWAGGGGGDTAKVEFYKKHRFVLCYENCVAPGYVTEKLLHAKMAGCIPLYRGAPEAVSDFDPDSFVHVQDGQDVVQLIQELEADPERAEKIARRGALSPSQLAVVQQRLNSIGRRLVEMATQKEKKQKQSLNEVIMPPQPPLFVSFATAAYLPALRIAIQSVEALRRQDSGIQMRVYLGTDVSSVDLGSWVQICRLPEPPAAFPDMYEPKMFGWKLQILHDLCLEEELAGMPVLYADAGAMWLSVSQDMLAVIHQSGICLVKDRTQINRHWCSNALIKAMGVTPEELEQNQLMASVIGFKAGSSAAKQLFDEALKWGSRKEVLFGEYLSGFEPDGHPFGHRHDQSILSILAGRYACPLVEGMRTVCEASLRKAYQKSTPVYLHRGKFTHHKQVLPGIDDVWGISLDRRPDRWQSLLEAHPDLVPILNRLPGIDGRLLELTPDLTNLFAKNDFKWKKSVTGCALSHILVWAQLASEHPLVQNYLILEDDCRFVEKGLSPITVKRDENVKDRSCIVSRQDAWIQQLADVMAEAPLDADLLMLGGVLPSNLHMYKDQLEPVTNTNIWATLKPNDLFSPNHIMPFFHFCAYSYVLTKTGAKKLLASLQTKGV